MGRIIVPETNMKRILLEIERLVPSGVELVGISKVDTTLVSPGEILERRGLL